MSVVALLASGGVGLWLLTARTLAHRTVNTVALVGSLVTLVAVLIAVVERQPVDLPWVPALDIRFALAVDGVSAPLLVLTAALGVLVVSTSSRGTPAGGSPGTFHGSVLLVVAGSLATFLARDAVLFFVAFEVVLIPMWILISRFGDPHDASARTDAGYRFLLYTALGSTAMLVGILTVVLSAGTADLGELAGGAAVPAGTQLVAATFLVLGLAVKVPVFPLHTWLPPAHTTAPTAGSVLLAAVLLKMGTYGLVRLPVATTPDGFATVAPFLAAAGAAGILWGGFACLVERDLKRLIAYSSVAHMGFVALALATGSEVGLQAALFANVAHGVISALLFLVVGTLKDRWGSADLATAHAALREVTPRLGFAFLLGLAASLGLPGLAGFWGEALSVYAAATTSAGPTWVFRVGAVAAVLGTVLAAAYALRVARLVWAGDRTEPRIEDASGPPWVGIAVLVVATVVLGVLPGPLLAVTADAVAGIVGGAR